MIDKDVTIERLGFVRELLRIGRFNSKIKANHVKTIDDAIVLLKEQEPKVLTLEEVEERMMSNDDYDSIFYAEVRTLTRTSFGIFQLLLDSEDYYVAILLGSSFPAWYRKESYGHRWRCWSAKPTKEQRESVKWE